MLPSMRAICTLVGLSLLLSTPFGLECWMYHCSSNFQRTMCTYAMSSMACVNAPHARMPSVHWRVLTDGCELHATLVPTPKLMKSKEHPAISRWAFMTTLQKPPVSLGVQYSKSLSVFVRFNGTGVYTATCTHPMTVLKHFCVSHVCFLSAQLEWVNFILHDKRYDSTKNAVFTALTLTKHKIIQKKDKTKR